eukprot:TRINITY_DN851_c0_g1_i1.p1 TRINITY_DN851_c0_g1~~TRINITY_DN851_c0_g1_i1.p1  ORF type:complete len:503 (+),score=210.94 TRINITY_DN851_c0_g1_i1:16-1524(+)
MDASFALQIASINSKQNNLNPPTTLFEQFIEQSTEKAASTSTSTSTSTSISLININKNNDNEFIKLVWSQKDKAAGIELSQDSLKATYKNLGRSDSETASIRTSKAIPSSSGISYWEITINNTGRDSTISIGFSTSQISLNRLPGWEKNSFGYNGSNGHCCYNQSSNSVYYGHVFKNGDIIGCCVNFIDNYVFYTRNNKVLPNIFTNKFKNVSSIYPMVGIRSKDAEIEANFGQKPFIFDFIEYVKNQRKLMIEEAEKIKLNDSISVCSSGLTGIPSLIVEHLVNNGHVETLQAFIRQAGEGLNRNLSESKENKKEINQIIQRDIESTQLRKKLKNFIILGHIDQALQELTLNFGTDFSYQNESIYFDLLTQKFIELIRVGDFEKAILFGRSELAKFDSIDKHYKQQVQELFSLIAYVDPINSPVAHLLNEKRRFIVALKLNRAIISYLGNDSYSVLEKAMKQIYLIQQETKINNPAESGILPFVNSLPWPNITLNDEKQTK